MNNGTTLAFDVHDMTCSHCAGAISRAVASVDPAAAVTVDLPGHRVFIASASTDASSVERAIRDAGYTPVPVVA